MDLNIEKSLKDPALLGGFVPQETYCAWFTALRAAYALPPQPGDLETFETLSGRTKWPTKPAREVWLIVGRRSGKTLTASLIGAHTAAFEKHSGLKRGERGTIAIVSVTKDQARIIANYEEEFFTTPMLADMVDIANKWEIRLKNNVDIKILTSDFRSLRGFSCPLVILEELAFFNTEGSRPDDEVLRAVRPTLATLDGLLVAISSPYARKGVVWQAYRRHWGVNDSEVLVIQAESRLLNPTLKKEVIDRAVEEDPAGSESEWFGRFRKDIESYISPEVLEACVVPGRYELPPVDGVSYGAFTDPAGGSGQDSFTLAISHEVKGVKILDLIRETRPPFSPDTTIQEYAGILKKYRIHTVYGDRFAGEFPREKFRAYGIEYKLSDRPKSDLYRDLLPILNSGQAELLEHNKMISQLTNLERRTARGGRDSIDHPPRAHDDLANAVAGVMVQSRTKRRAGPVLKSNRERRLAWAG